LGDDPRVSVNRRRQNPRCAAIEKKMEIACAIACLSIIHRTRKNLTQKQLAERMKTGVTAISRLESGSHNPALETLGKLAEG
jgi:ribosome-binding protein aMBF1 (putative translation factor)